MHLPWPEPAWFYALLFALTWPTFGPKGRPKAGAAQREERLRQELRDYMDANAGQCPPTTSALYTKLRRANVLRLLEAEKSAREEQLRQAEQQKKEVQLRQELRDYMDANAGQSPPTTSALYSKLRRADLLRLLEAEKSAREEQLRQAEQQKKEVQLRQELRDYMDANAGQSPPTTSALYSKLRRADLLRLLEEERLPMEAQLGQELRDYMEANAGQPPPTTSALYSKLRRAGLLRLLEAEKSAREEQLRQAEQQKKEVQLRQELRDYMDANAGQPPPTTSALYSKLRRADMLRLLKDMLPRGQGPDTAPLDEQLRGGVFKFVADKTVLDCLPYLADLPGTAFQRYSHDAAADRRCCFADIVIAVCRGFESAAFFSMHYLSVDEQTAALDWLETCPVATSDDTASVRARVESFCVAESRWPDKDGGHSLDLELVTAIQFARSALVVLELLSTSVKGCCLTMRCLSMKTRCWRGKPYHCIHASCGGRII